MDVQVFNSKDDLARAAADHAAEIIARHLRRLIPSSLVAFFIYDVSRDELVISHATGDGAALVRGLRISLGQRLSGWVAANRKTILNSDASLDLGETARAPSLRREYRNHDLEHTRAHFQLRALLKR